MRVRVERLRWLLLGVGIALLAVLAVLLSYGRYKSLRAWHRALERTGASLTRETDGITWSQSLGGRTVFTLHAAKAVQGANGKYSLHDVSLTLFRQAGGPPDRIYGSDFEYDQNTGVARGLGEVHMDLRAPATGHEAGAVREAGPKQEDDAAEPETIHVRTSGLVYLRKLGVAATDQPVEFRYGNLECTARGAEFDAGQSTVHLLADVRAGGEVRGHAVHLTAARVDLDRRTNVATLTQPEVSATDGQATAASAVLHLRPDGLLTSAEANGSVRFVRGSQRTEAERGEISMVGGTSLRTARFTGGVNLFDGDKARPVRGHAETVEANFGAGGAPERAVLSGNASLAAGGVVPSAGPVAAAERSVSGERILITFAKETGGMKPTPQQVKVEGRAKLFATSAVRERASDAVIGASSPQGKLQQTGMSADELLVHFAPGAGDRLQPESAVGQGHTALEQTQPDGSSSRSTGDRLSLLFASVWPGPKIALPARGPFAGTAGVELQSAVQEGAVTLRSVSRTANSAKKVVEQITEATAGRAVFHAPQRVLSLTEHAHVWSEEGDLSAEDVELDSVTRDVSATEQVRATLTQASSEQRATGRRSKEQGEVTHVAAARAHFSHAAATAEFSGTDQSPVRLWQGASQLQAASIVLDRQRNALAARPEFPTGFIRAVLVQQGPIDLTSRPREPSGLLAKAKPARAEGTSAGVLRVTGARLDYSALTHEARFAGNVVVNAPVGEVRSQTALVLLQNQANAGKQQDAAGSPVGMASTASVSNAFLGESVSSVILTGKVRLEQPGRTGTGEQLLYTPATSSFVLTGAPGHPPRILDAQQGSVSGDTLLFQASDNTVVVAGTPGQSGTKRGRVRTELNLRP